MLNKNIIRHFFETKHGSRIYIIFSKNELENLQTVFFNLIILEIHYIDIQFAPPCTYVLQNFYVIRINIY